MLTILSFANEWVDLFLIEPEVYDDAAQCDMWLYMAADNRHPAIIA